VGHSLRGYIAVDRPVSPCCAPFLAPPLREDLLFWGLLFISLFTLNFGWGTSAYYVLEVYLLEFIPFITLLMALFTVSGGIHLRGALAGTPGVNAAILLLGTFLASWMGTTGAAMLLIRPLIRANEGRTRKTHVIVFFIFLVANIGGSLTPLGDPPLFLGYLKGVSFFCTTRHLIMEMMTATAILIVLFYAIDTIVYRREPVKQEPARGGEKISFEGKADFILLAAVIGAVIASSLDLGTAFTIHHVPVPLASVMQVALLLAITAASILITKKEVRVANEFSWEPIREVAKLFAAIFITMVMPFAMLKAGA